MLRDRNFCNAIWNHRDLTSVSYVKATGTFVLIYFAEAWSSTVWHLKIQSYGNENMYVGDIVLFCISYNWSVILTDKHNHIDLIYWYFVQHYYTFRLSASAIIKLASVHKNKTKQKGERERNWYELESLSYHLGRKYLQNETFLASLLCYCP